MRAYFHLSSKYHGDKIEWNPRKPDWGRMDFNEDSKTKRIMVAPTLRKCLLAICNAENSIHETKNPAPKYAFLYKTVGKIKKIDKNSPKKVFDWPITHETWILSKQKFKLDKVFRMYNWGWVSSHDLEISDEPKYREITKKISVDKIKKMCYK